MSAAPAWEPGGWRSAVERGQQQGDRGGVAEGLAHVRVAVDVARAEDEAPAELEHVLAGPPLPVAGRPGTATGGEVVPAEQVAKRGGPEVRRAVGFPLRVDQERESDSGLVAERPGVGEIPEADRGHARATRSELGLVVAQLRDVLPAEHSAVVAEEDEGRGRVSPERA